MDSSPGFVLDASALLAHLRKEPGDVIVQAAMASGALMNVVNYSEVLSRLADEGDDPEAADSRLRLHGVIGGSVELVEVTEDDAIAMAQLRVATRAHGLSLGDRSCLATGLRLGRPVLTADRSWATVQTGVTVSLIRP